MMCLHLHTFCLKDVTEPWWTFQQFIHCTCFCNTEADIQQLFTSPSALRRLTYRFISISIKIIDHNQSNYTRLVQKVFLWTPAGKLGDETFDVWVVTFNYTKSVMFSACYSLTYEQDIKREVRQAAGAHEVISLDVWWLFTCGLPYPTLPRSYWSARIKTHFFGMSRQMISQRFPVHDDGASHYLI